MSVNVLSDKIQSNGRYLQSTGITCKSIDASKVESSTFAGKSIVLSEQASQEAPDAGKACLWVKNETPNALVFTNDAGTETIMGGLPVEVTQPTSLASDVTSNTADTIITLYSAFGSGDFEGDGPNFVFNNSLITESSIITAKLYNVNPVTTTDLSLEEVDALYPRGLSEQTAGSVRVKMAITSGDVTVAPKIRVIVQ